MKGQKSYVTELNRLIKNENGGELPKKLTPLIRTTAICMTMLEKIDRELEKSQLLIVETGSMGQTKQVVNPLLATHEKYLARLQDLLYNLGLSNRKAAAKPDERVPEEEDPMAQFAKSVATLKN